MPLCTQDDVEKLLQINFGNDPDDSVTQYMAQAQATADAYCNQPLEYTVGIEDTFEARSNSPWHNLTRFPVTAVTSVVEDGDTLTETDDYLWYPDGRLRRVAGSADWIWSTYANAVVVTYNAGYGGAAPSPYDATPNDLVLAVASVAALLFRQGAQFAAHGVDGPVASIALAGSDSVSYAAAIAATDSTDQTGLTPGQKQLLAPYVRRIL